MPSSLVSTLRAGPFQSNLSESCVILAGPGDKVFNEQHVFQLEQGMKNLGYKVYVCGNGIDSIEPSQYNRLFDHVSKAKGRPLVIVFAHGAVFGNSTHLFSIEKSSAIVTADFLRKLSASCNGKPIDIFNVSCESGVACREAVAILPANSRYVALSGKGQMTADIDVFPFVRSLYRNLHTEYQQGADRLLNQYLLHGTSLRIDPLFPNPYMASSYWHVDLKENIRGRLGRVFSDVEKNIIMSELHNILPKHIFDDGTAKFNAEQIIHRMVQGIERSDSHVYYRSGKAYSLALAICNSAGMTKDSLRLACTLPFIVAAICAYPSVAAAADDKKIAVAAKELTLFMGASLATAIAAIYLTPTVGTILLAGAAGAELTDLLTKISGKQINDMSHRIIQQVTSGEYTEQAVGLESYFESVPTASTIRSDAETISPAIDAAPRTTQETPRVPQLFSSVALLEKSTLKVVGQPQLQQVTHDVYGTDSRSLLQADAARAAARSSVTALSPSLKLSPLAPAEIYHYLDQRNSVLNQNNVSSSTRNATTILERPNTNIQRFSYSPMIPSTIESLNISAPPLQNLHHSSSHNPSTQQLFKDARPCAPTMPSALNSLGFFNSASSRNQILPNAPLVSRIKDNQAVLPNQLSVLGYGNAPTMSSLAASFNSGHNPRAAQLFRNAEFKSSSSSSHLSSKR